MRFKIKENIKRNVEYSQIEVVSLTESARCKLLNRGGYYKVIIWSFIRTPVLFKNQKLFLN